MDIKNLESIAKNVVAPIDFIQADVDFGSGIIPGYAQTYVSAMNSKLALRGSALQFDESEMSKYLNLLLKLRIDQTSGRAKSDFRARNLKIPALYSIALLHIGKVYDPELGIELVPTYGKMDCMSVEDAMIYSMSKLSIVEDLGFQLVLGLPKETNGDTNFMYFHSAEEKIVRHDRKAHPSFALLTAFFRLKQLDNLLNFRVSYGMFSEYESMLKGLIYDEAR